MDYKAEMLLITELVRIRLKMTSEEVEEHMKYVPTKFLAEEICKLRGVYGELSEHEFSSLVDDIDQNFRKIRMHVQ